MPRLDHRSNVSLLALFATGVVMLAIATLLMGAAAATAALSFDTFALPVGESPQGLAADDCTGDGLADLVVANFGSDTVTLLRNDGHGRFAIARTIPTVHQPAGVACTDLTGDGRADVAVTSHANATVMVHRAEADGTFTSLAEHPVGQQPRSVVSADFDGDGHRDLLVVNARSSGLSLLLGDGHGAFPYHSTIRLPAQSRRNAPLSAAVDDYDHDGFPDVAVVSQGSPPLRLLRGGPFGFEFAEGALPLPPNPRSAASTDLDGDGIPDLAVLSTDATVRLYLGAGGGRLAAHETLLVAPDARALALADLDGDGFPDLATVHAKTNTVQVLLASGPARFPAPATPPSLRTVNVTGTTAVRPTATGEEAVAADQRARTLAQLASHDTAALAPIPLATLPGAPTALVLADLNGDTVRDAIVALTGKPGTPLSILLGTTSGGYLPLAAAASRCGDGVVDGVELCDDGNTTRGDGCSATCMPEVKPRLRSLEPADMDGDGHLDLVVVDARWRLFVLLGNGRGGFRAIRRLGTVRAKTAIVVGEFTNDGDPDIVFVAHGKPGLLSILRNDGTGSFTAAPLTTDASLTGPLLATDLDRNGFVDLAVGRGKRAGFVVLFNDGDGPARATGTVPAPAALRALAAADFDENGWPDVLATFVDRALPPLVYLGGPDGRLEPQASFAVPDAAAGVTIVDVNEDLHADLVMCTPGVTATCRPRYGDGAARFTVDPPGAAARGVSYVGRQPRGLGAADFDGDGTLDWIATSRSDHRTVVLYRGPDGAIVARAELAAGTKPTALATGDLDGDGRVDAVVVSEGSNDLSLFLNRGPRHFVAAARIALPGGVHPSALAIGDLNADGRADVAVALADGDAVAVYLNRGAAGLATAGLLPVGDNPQALALADLDADGLLDIVTANLDADTLSVLRSSDAYAVATLPSGGSRPTDVHVADLNGDGAPDLVTVHEATRTLATFLNDGAGTLVPGTSTSTAGRRRPWNLCVGDFDGDGASDVAVASIATADLLVLHGDGRGGWTGDTRVYPVGEDPRPVLCTDTDGDGRDDVVFARRRSGRIDAVLSGG